MSENYFTKLFDVNVSDKEKNKNGQTYLPWAWAWAELKKIYPSAEYNVYENAQGWNYHTDGKTCWVKTGVKVEHIEHVEYLPVMDYKNKSISAEQVTSFDVNKAIQRSLTKAAARHGLGMHLYTGEDPFEDSEGRRVSQGKDAEQELDAEKAKTMTIILNKKNKKGVRFFSEESIEKYRKMRDEHGIDEALKHAEIALEELESAE